MLSIILSVVLQCMVIFLFLNETVSTILTFVGTHQQLLLSVPGTLQELSLRGWPRIHKSVRTLGFRYAENPVLLDVFQPNRGSLHATSPTSHCWESIHS